MSTDRVSTYDSQSAAYERAFQVFLEHTDQKAKARAKLDELLQNLPQRRTLIDAGAGNGKVTAWLTDQFERTIAIEPNPHLRAELGRSCPSAEILPGRILDAVPSSQGDLVLCSHVFYYLEQPTWMEHLERLASWLAPQGLLVVILQNEQTDCMRLLDHFLHHRFQLAELARRFREQEGVSYEVEVETVAAHIATADLEAAYLIAEFMLNLLPMPDPPARRDVEEYVRTRFADPAGGYRFSCDQDFMQIRLRR